MFSTHSLYSKPLIQMRDRFKGDLPDYFHTLYSSQFWFYMESDEFEKIVAMRVYPYQNCIAFKLRAKGNPDFVSVILKEPQLRILKRIWDCGSDGFNFAIKYYMINSHNACEQWITHASHSSHCIDWYKTLVMGDTDNG